MILSTCPRCSESLRVPETELPADAYAQCPWCSETFPVFEITDHLPPIVHLWDANGQPLAISHAAVAAGIVGSAEANPFTGAVIDDSDRDAGPGADTVVSDTWQESAADEDLVTFEEEAEDAGEQQHVDELGFESESAAVGAVDIQVATPNESVAERDHQPMRVRAKPTSKKKGSPIRTLIGVALGPVLALPLVALILWALGKPLPNLGFWPFDGSLNKAQQRSAAPPSDFDSSTRSQSAGTQKPRVLNSGGSLLDDDSAVAKAAKDIAGDSPSNTLSGPDGQLSDLNQGRMTLPAEEDTRAKKRRPASKQVADASEQLVIPDGVAVYPGDTQAVSKQPKKPTIDKDAASSQLELKPSSMVIKEPGKAETSEPESNTLRLPESSVPELVPELTKSRDSPELLAAIESASDWITDLQSKRAESAGTPRDLAMTYVAISAVGTQDADPNSESMKELLDQISASPLLEDLSIAGPQWWNYSTRPNNGILLIGAADGDANGSTITLKGKEKTAVVPVILPSGVSLPKSDRVIALGLITNGDGSSAVQLTAIQPLP